MKNKKSTIYLGLDVSKEKLDFSGTENNKIGHQTFKNTSKGIKALMSFLQPLSSTTQIILEPTGNYERNVVEALGNAQIAFSRVNAYQVRSFATGIGKLAKTDKLDALVLAKFGEHCQPKPTQRIDKAHEQLRALYDRREQLLNARTRESNRLETVLPTMKTHLKKSLFLLINSSKKLMRCLSNTFLLILRLKKKSIGFN